MNIIITLAGHSRRFRDAGYTVPKFLILIDGKTMLEHVLDMYSENDKFYFILNDEQIEEYPYLLDWLKKQVLWSKVLVIPKHEFGPVYTALAIKDINDDEPVIISYCDIYVEWSYSNFKREIIGYDAAIPCFKGFHPASFGHTKYAYVRVDDNLELLELKEKDCFTDNRKEEFASAGIYYFKTWDLFKRSANILMEEGFKNLNEWYVSLISNIIIRNGCSVKITAVDKFISFGTPEDVSLYHFWSDYFLKNQFKEINTSSSIEDEQINVIPMAGRGSRFKNEFYNVSKPLIMIGKELMFLKACNSLPAANKWIFLFRQEIIARHKMLQSLIDANFNDSELTPVERETSGQAATCLLAESSIKPDAPLLIASCDYVTIYDNTRWDAIIKDKTIDVIIWTFRMGSMLTKSPTAFAYCKVGENGSTVTQVVEKATISDTPEKDPLLIGTFWFRYGRDFLHSAKYAVENNINVNGEHYIGNSLNTLISEGKKIVIFDIEQWVSLGDPFELDMFYYWDDFFHTRYKSLRETSRRLYSKV